MGRMGITFLCKGIKHEGVKLSMESFLDTIWNRNLYIGIPLGAFCCSLFLLFCFFHTMRSRTIREKPENPRPSAGADRLPGLDGQCEPYETWDISRNYFLA